MLAHTPEEGNHGHRALGEPTPSTVKHVCSRDSDRNKSTAICIAIATTWIHVIHVVTWVLPSQPPLVGANPVACLPSS